MAITRREFVRNGALAVAGTAAIPSFLARAADGVTRTMPHKKRLVVIFQRGGADGLNMIVPHGDPAYYALRPSINIPRSAVIDLDGFFGLHPALASFYPLWEQRRLAIVHAAGSPHPTRSHFEAQDFMESGTPGLTATDDGWLNRALACPAATDRSAFRAVAPGPLLPRILSGCEPAAAISNVNPGKMLNSSEPAKYKPARGANYPEGQFSESLKQLAHLIKANPRVQVAFADIGGWDHHVNQGGTHGRIASILRDFSQSLAAFWRDLGDLREDTVIVTMSEFGRAAQENRNGGTDHGHGSVMFVLGGPVKGGKVYGRWPGLDSSQLHEGRDLAVTTDFRRVLGEVVHTHLDNKALDRVFPGFENQPAEFLRLL